MVIHNNVQGLLGSFHSRTSVASGYQHKLDYLRFITSLLYALSIFCATESKLDNNILDDEVNIPGYTVLRRDRDRRGGGIAMYFAHTLTIEQLQLNSKIEALAVKVSSPHAKTIIIVCVHRPPSSNVSWMDKFKCCLNELSLSYKYPVFLIHDFDVDLCKDPAIFGAIHLRDKLYKVFLR